MAAKFVVKKGSTGQYRFNLVAANGEIIATSESYTTKAAAMKGIASVKKNAESAILDDQTGTGTSTSSSSTAAPTASAGTFLPESPDGAPSS